MKALFVKEIEEALLKGTVDLAVHSAKDLPAELPPGLTVAAYPEREDTGDLLIARVPLKELAAQARIATSSLRRQIQIRMLRPDLQTVAVRGNVDTRLRKLVAGEFEGLVLAAAGLHRLARKEQGERLDMVPAPGQGALAIEARADGVGTLKILGGLDDRKCRTEVEAERRFLRAIGGGCRTPLGALAEMEGHWIRLTVFWSDEGGKRPVRLSARSKAAPAALQETVDQLADRVRQLAAAPGPNDSPKGTRHGGPLRRAPGTMKPRRGGGPTGLDAAE